MTMRNSGLVSAAILVMIAVLAAMVLSRGGGTPALAPEQQGTAILQVPGRYATIQAAIDAARPGDIIQVAAGTYRENLTLNKPVALTAARPGAQDAAGNSTVIDGGNGRAAVLVPAGLEERPSLHGFVIRNGRYGIEAHSELVIEDAYFYGSETSVQYAAASGGVNRNNVYFNSADDAVHVENAGLPLLIQGNRFLYAGDDAIELDFPDSGASTGEVDILDNVLAGSSQDGIKLVDYGSSPADANRRVVAAGNLIANNRRAGFGVVPSGNTNEVYSGADMAEPVSMHNNTFYGNNYAISGGDNVVAFNNIIANSSSRGAWRVRGPLGADSTISYTLFWNNTVDADESTLGTGDIFGQDPLFAGVPGPGPDGAWGTADDDFSGLVLRPGSAAIDRGVAQYTTASGEHVPASPLTGFAGAAPDLGWKESGSAPVPAPTSAAQPTAAPAATSTGIAPPTATHKAAPTSRKVNDTPTATAIPSTPSPTNSPPAAASATPTAMPTLPATPQMSIDSVTPSSAGNHEVVTLTINGSGFEEGASVSFEGGEGTPPTVYAVQVVGPTTIIATMEAVNSTSSEQTWDVRVNNPDGSSAAMERAFSVTP